ncbi:MAG: M1 family metallopeptidase [Lachnospiraceae bacterium]|nr:M1 family metallopeptidase [Lachnospiraceae bacterium]
MVRGKKALCLLLLCLIAAVMCACGKDADGREKKATDTPTGEASQPTETPAELTETPTATATPVETPTETVTPTEAPTPSVIPAAVPWPDKGCAISFPERELYHYDMDLTLNPSDRTLRGHVIFDFYNDSGDTWDTLCFRDYSSLFIDAKTAGYGAKEYSPNGALTEITNIRDGRNDTVLSFERDKDVSVIWMKPATPLAPGEKMTLSFDFTAKIPTVADRYGVCDDVWNVTNFYPILAEYDGNGWSHEAFVACGECFYSEVSNYDVRLSVPKGFIVASTGTESSRKEEGDRVVYTMKAPCVRDFVFSASDRFVVHEADFDGVHVNLMYNGKLDNEVFWYDESPYRVGMSDAVQASLKAAKDSLAAFGEALGRYPYDELDIIISKIDAGGMEYPNLIIITDEEIYPMGIAENPEAQDPEQMVFKPSFEPLETCIAHEIGHQWFMGIVGSNSGIEPWLDESITSYTEVIYKEYLSARGVPDDRYDFSLRLSRRTTDMCDVTQLKYMMQRGMLPLNQSYYEFKTDDDYISAIYSEGQRALFQMEEILGHDEFMAVLREYVRRNAFTNSDTSKFFEVLFERAGRDNADLNKLIDNLFDLDRVK